MVPAINPKVGNQHFSKRDQLDQWVLCSEWTWAIYWLKEGKMRCWFQVSMPCPSGCWRPICPFSHQVKDMCRRKDGQKCTTNLLQAINHELGQFSVTSSRSSSTLIIHEERVEYGFLRAKRVLFIAVLSGPSMPSRCSLVLLHSVVQSFQQTQSASVCSVLPRTGKRRH